MVGTREARAARARLGSPTGRAVTRITVVLCAVAVVFAVAACGGSSKPQYCSDRSSLEKTVKSIPGMVTSKDISGLQSVGTKLQNEANTLVSSAKSDFPQQTSAIKSSINSLESALKALPSSPSASDYVNVATAAVGAVSSVSSFVSATSSKC
jgi:hypothetical protein